jgi:hypothetical protein
MEPPQSSEVDGGERLSADVPRAVLAAVERLVRKKYEVDRAAWAKASAEGRRLGYGGCCPEEPQEFFRARFPFFEVLLEGPLERAFVAEAPTAQTLGCSWRWRAEGEAPEVRQERLRELRRPPRDTDDVNYLWIRNLGLYVPREGKNRVDFFRELDAEMIPAFVTRCTYPAPQCFGVYEMGQGEHRQIWIVLDGERAQPAPVCFGEIEDLWRAYGVAPCRRWPELARAELPSAERVAAAYAAARRPWVRFDELREADARESAVDPARGHAGARWVWVAALCALVAALLVLLAQVGAR